MYLALLERKDKAKFQKSKENKTTLRLKEIVQLEDWQKKLIKDFICKRETIWDLYFNDDVCTGTKPCVVKEYFPRAYKPQ